MQVSVSTPPLAHDTVRVELGAQTPSPVHDPYAPHEPLASQVRVWVPQLPQPMVSLCPGVHTQVPSAQPDARGSVLLVCEITGPFVGGAALTSAGIGALGCGPQPNRLVRSTRELVVRVFMPLRTASGMPPAEP